jgi:tripartite motif-containing protein 71
LGGKEIVLCNACEYPDIVVVRGTRGDFVARERLTPGKIKQHRHEIDQDENRKDEVNMNHGILFLSPIAVAVGSSGDVYVCDQSNHNIQKFDSEGTFITSWGSFSASGTGEGQFFHPMGVAVDSSENVYVVDFRADLIQKFDSGGTFITMWSSEGCARVDVGSSGNIYVTDHVNMGVQKFESEGTFITSWGRKGRENGRFRLADGVAVDSSENVYVSDALGNSRIQKFDPEGTFIMTWGRRGKANGQFHNPHGVAVDSSENVYVADMLNHRIQKFDSDGTFIATWGSGP